MRLNKFLKELDYTLCGKTSTRVAKLLTRFHELEVQLPIMEHTVEDLKKSQNGALQEVLKEKEMDLKEMQEEYNAIKSELVKIKELLNNFDAEG